MPLDERWGETEAEVADALRGLLAKESARDVVRRAESDPGGRDERLERALDDFGLWDLPAAPQLLAAVAWELGRALAPVPFVEAAPVAAVLDLPATAYGLEGPVPSLLDRAVVAGADGRLHAVGVRREAGRRTAAGDVLAPAAEVGADAPVLGGEDEAARLRSLARLLDAARLVGAAEGLLALGVDHARTRRQFGRPVGAFQAVAHRLADAAIAVDGAGLLVRKAAWVAERLGEGDSSASMFAAMARAQAVAAALLAATHVHQVMGGIGFSTEADCQLFSRRIRAWALRLQPPDVELAGVARLLLDPARRDAARHLWHHDRGVPLPRWAAEDR